uniref:Trimeric intracellular cation channel type A n=1 Tax=Castor canadensis TaxID=51338 RepID=A0A8C0WET5_CASCN
MELLSALSLGELALSFSRVPLFPVFDLSYFIVSILYLKYEPGAVELSRRHPVASWLCAMLHCFGSYILADLLLGEPVTDYFSNNSSVLLASAVWYLIFFCPMDLFYKCVCFLPVKLIFVAMKEVVRVRKIAVGIHHAHHHYHHGWFVMIATGWVKGAGVALLSNFEQLLRGVWKPETNEIMHMSFPTKASLYGAVLFTLQQTRWLPVSKASLIFLFTMFMVSCKVRLPAPLPSQCYPGPPGIGAGIPEQVAHTWAACQEAGTAFPGPGPSLSEKQRCPGASGGESRTGGWELPGVVVPACNPSPGGVEAGGSQVPDQPEPPNTTVSKYKEKGPERGSGRGESAWLALGSIAKNLDPLARQQK